MASTTTALMPLKLVNLVKRLPLHWKILLGAQAVVTMGLMMQRRDLQLRYRKAKELEQQELLQSQQTPKLNQSDKIE